MKTKHFASPQLSIFRASTFEKPPAWWQLSKYTGPRVGDICQVGFCLALSLSRRTLGCITVTHAYILKINEATREVLVHCPLLHDAPWCKDEWFITDLYSCDPNTTYNFNETEFRDKNIQKEYSGEIPWDLFNIKIENRKYNEG